MELVPQTPLKGDAQNPVAIDHEGRFTHVRLRNYPEGGVARLRLHGEALPDKKQFLRPEIDLVAVENGGAVLASSDQFYGAPSNLLMPGDARNMGDGWETKRRRGPGFDWTIVRLGTAGVIRRIEIDTRHFKGNAPGACSLEGCSAAGVTAEMLTAGSVEWRELLTRLPLLPDARQVFEDEVRAIGEVTDVRFNIYPDGGVGRLRLFGRPCQLKD